MALCPIGALLYPARYGDGKKYADASIKAYEEIEQITEEYNRIENGKWRYMMDFRPRRLPVFNKPSLGNRIS